MGRFGNSDTYLHSRIKDQDKTRSQLIDELDVLRRQVFDLQKRINGDQRTRHELARLERMCVVGQLAAGTIHNLRNVLTGVTGPAQLLQQTAIASEIAQELETIVDASLQARDVVDNLALCVRDGREALQAVDVNKGVLAAVKATKSRWKDEAKNEGISFEVITQLGQVPYVMATRSGLHNVLINLIFNAVDAMPQGGEIFVRTAIKSERVVILIQDAGVGMGPEVLADIFKPFFTTKGERGTGLGLSTVADQLSEWGGHVCVTSQKGEGSTFVLYLDPA